MDLERLLEEAERIRVIVPSCEVFFSMDNFANYIIIREAERRDLHRLARVLRQHFYLQRSCSGNYRAFNSKEVFDPDGTLPNLGLQHPSVPILVLTKMRCKKCDEAQKGQEARAIVNLLLKTNIRASIWRTWRFLFATFWIGRGYNPDYTQACTQGTCAATGDCVCLGKTCRADTCNFSGACGCPAPTDPNSSQTVACTTSCAKTSKCKTGGESCTSGVPSTCYNPTGCGVVDCTAGTCGYTCNSGYTWNGSQCVPGGNVRDRTFARSLRHNRTSGTLKYSPSSALFAKLLYLLHR